MHVLASLLLASSLVLLARCTAIRPGTPDETAGSSPAVGQETSSDLEFSAVRHKPSVTRTQSALQLGYAIDVRSSAHNVDDEPSIVGLRCSSLDHVDVEVADDAVLRSWGPQFVLLASPAWGCVEGALRRHVVGVEWTSQRMARLKTTRASSEDELSNATIHVVIGGGERGTKTTRDDNFREWRPPTTVGWNQDLNAVTPTVEILKNTCLDACTTSEQKQTIRCLLCEAGVQTRSTVECHNCWSHTTLNQANLTIEWPLKDMAKHQKTVSVATTSEYHFGEVAFWMDAPGTALLVKEGISSSTFFENVSITEDLYIPITVTMTTNLIVDATLVTTPIFNSSVSYSIRSGQYGGSARIGVTTSGVVRMTHKYKRDSPSMTSTATWVQGALTPSVTGKATGRASVRVLMEQMYDIHIGNYSVIGSKVVSTTFGSTAFELQPPFGPMAGGKHGPCDKRHLLRLEGSHTVSTTAGRTLVLAAKGISKQGWWPKLIGRVATDAGCWRRSSGMTEVVLQFKDKVADVIKLRDDVLRSGIVYEVARAVKVNTFDIIANIARDPKSISITFILEENGPQTGERLALQAKYWDSVLWKGRLLSQLRSSFASVTQKSDEPSHNEHSEPHVVASSASSAERSSSKKASEAGSSTERVSSDGPESPNSQNRTSMAEVSSSRGGTSVLATSAILVTLATFLVV